MPSPFSLSTITFLNLSTYLGRVIGVHLFNFIFDHLVAAHLEPILNIMHVHPCIKPSLKTRMLCCFIILGWSLISLNAIPVGTPGSSFSNLAISASSQEYILSPHFDINSNSTTRRFILHVSESTAALDGFLRPVLAINGQIPGPLIEANEGDRLEITVINQMSVPLTMHWHGLYQNGSNWEDGVTGVTQCPIPPYGGEYTYKFNLNGQFGTFWYHSHHQNLMADGINGPMIVHSPRDPLKRSVDFDQDVVLILTDWYHNTSSDIVHYMLSHKGYAGTSAAPGANSALINGIGEWNCSYATESQECQRVHSPPEFIFKAGEKVRFRLINAGVHTMFFYSVDEHTLNLTEADATGIYGPPALHRIQIHNGQRYSVIINTKEKDAGKSFYMRAIMDVDCWAWVPNDIQPLAFGILRLISDQDQIHNVSSARPQTRDWQDKAYLEDCLDLKPDSMVPIVKRSVPTSVVGSGAFHSAFGFYVINGDAGDYIPRSEALKLAEKSSKSNHYLLQSPSRPTPELGLSENPTKSESLNLVDPQDSVQSTLSRRQVKVGEEGLSYGGRVAPLGITRNREPPPAPTDTIGKFFVNNITWLTFPYQPILHDLAPGGVGFINGSRVANVIVSIVALNVAVTSNLKR